MDAPAQRTGRAYGWGAGLLGFALGGFFDGILLHQILQWHHLLSAVGDPAVQDIRVQILADGLFHAGMYLVAMAGLALLWRGRRDAGRPGAGRRLLAAAAIGFGAWHVADAVAFHWLLGLHRIRMAADNRLVWDLVFFVPGVLLVALGWALRRRAPRELQPGRATAPLLLAAAVLAAGPAAALPPRDGAPAAIVFRDGLSAAAALAAIVDAGGRPVWHDARARVWLADLPAAGRWSLYSRGALLVGGAGLPAGCGAWLRAS